MSKLNCPICASEQLSVFMTGVYDSDDTSVIECANCGLQFLDPMMSQEEEDEYYHNYYANQKSRHYTSLSLKNIQERAHGHYMNYHDVLSAYFKGVSSALEIGSGSGGFLVYMKQFSEINEIVSVERSVSNLEFLQDEKQNDFKNVSFVEDIEVLPKDKKFDMIVAFGLFEHIKDSGGFLQQMRDRLVSDDSLLIMNVPNKYDPLVYLYEIEEFKRFAYMKQHYYTFSERSLELLARKINMNVEDFIYLQTWGLDNHVSWLRNRKPQDFSKFTNVFSKETIQSYNQDLIKSKKTDSMMVVLRKK